MNKLIEVKINKRSRLGWNYAVGIPIGMIPCPTTYPLHTGTIAQIVKKIEQDKGLQENLRWFIEKKHILSQQWFVWDNDRKQYLRLFYPSSNEFYPIFCVLDHVTAEVLND